jgi:hypothetical protein
MVKKALTWGMRSFARAFGGIPPRPHPLRALLVGPSAGEEAIPLPASDEMRLFVTAWLGGLVFFGTFLG